MSAAPTSTESAAAPSATDQQSPLSMKTFTIPITLAFTIVGCVCIGAIFFFVKKHRRDKRRREQEAAEQAADEAARIEMTVQSKTTEPRLVNGFQFSMLHAEFAKGQLFCAERTAREPESCIVCLMDIDTDDRLVYLPCDHGYHGECIREWLLEKSDRCPLCKKSVLAGLGISVTFCSTRHSEDEEERTQGEG